MVTKIILNLKKTLKNLEATETDFVAKGYEKCKVLSELLETKIIILDDYAKYKKNYNFLYSKIKNMIGGLATNHFVMQKLFTVQKENQLHTEHGLDAFLTNCNHNNLKILRFSNFN